MIKPPVLPTPEAPTAPPPTPQPATKPPAIAPTHIFLIVMAHQEFPHVIGNPAALYLNPLVSRYALSTVPTELSATRPWPVTFFSSF